MEAARSKRVARRAHIVCLQCGVSLAERRATKYCSVRCADISYGNRFPEPLPEQVCALSTCSESFQPKRTNQRCCSEKHGRERWNELNPDRRHGDRSWNDTKRDAYHRRRALKAGTASGEKVDFAVILERDRWTCHLCGKRISKAKKWPDPLSPSQDHVVPLSQGGTHDPANVRAAHLVCNVRKSTGGGGEQLAMIG